MFRRYVHLPSIYEIKKALGAYVHLGLFAHANHFCISTCSLRWFYPDQVLRVSILRIQSQPATLVPLQRLYAII